MRECVCKSEGMKPGEQIMDNMELRKRNERRVMNLRVEIVLL